jgi:hypothetical protein
MSLNLADAEPEERNYRATPVPCQEEVSRRLNRATTAEDTNGKANGYGITVALYSTRRVISGAALKMGGRIEHFPSSLGVE